MIRPRRPDYLLDYNLTRFEFNTLVHYGNVFVIMEAKMLNQAIVALDPSRQFIPCTTLTENTNQLIGRAVTWLKGNSTGATLVNKMTQLGQCVLVAYLGYEINLSTVNSNSDSQADMSANYLALAGGISAILIGSLCAEAFRCNKRDYKSSRIIAPPLTMATALMAGVLTSTIQATVESQSMVNHYENDIQKWMALNYSFFNGCVETVYANASLFTSKNCSSCKIDGWPGPLGDENIIQAWVQENVNLTICNHTDIAAVFPYLRSIEANHTVSGQIYPCGGILTSQESSTTLMERSVMQFFSSLYNLNPPMILLVLLLNETCKRVTGFGTHLYDMTSLCSSYSSDSFDLMMPCATQKSVAYFNNITIWKEKIEEQMPLRPNNAFFITESEQLLITVGVTTFLFLTAVTWYAAESRLQKKSEERGPLLVSSVNYNG